MVKRMSDSEQKGFVVYGDYKAIVDELNDIQAGKLFRAMLDYFVDGSDPDVPEDLKYVFILIKQQMDRDGCKYKKKCERNRANVNKRWNKNDTNNTTVYDGIRTYTNDTNTNTNTNKEKDTNTNTKPHESGDSISLSLLSFLNSETGGSYTETEQFDDLVQDLFNKGYTEQDIRTVIHRKAIEWSCDGKMRSLLRPSVLLGDKFEEYLNAPEPIQVEEQKQNAEKSEQLRTDLESKFKEHNAISDQIQQMRDDGSADIDYDKFNDLKLQAAILEQEIESLQRRLGDVT